MLSTEQRQDVLDLLRADHADGSPFTLDEVVAVAKSPLVGTADGPDTGPTENEVRMLIKSWEWRALVVPGSGSVHRFRRHAA